METQNQKHQTLSKPMLTRVNFVPEGTVPGGRKMGDCGGGPNDTGSCQPNNRDFFAQLS